MEADAIMQAIGTLGFPIVMCGVMFWYLQKEQEAHKAEMQLMTEALDRNTNVLIELKTIISMLTSRERKNADSKSQNLQ